MNRRSRFLLIAMSTAFTVCILGLVLGMLYYVGAVYFADRTLESVMRSSSLFNKILGSIGILGMVLFFAFLFSLLSKNHSEKPR